LHLDHGVDIEIAKKCQKAGYSSVMIDGSQLPLNDNINLTKEGVDYMKPRKISVEGELGAIGGKEEGDIFLESKYTKVSEAIKFASETGVDTLAIGVGTAHGVYKGTPKINFERIKEINKAVDTPLVLHGATGLSDDVILKCIDNGITKINYATELRLSFTNSLRQSLQADLDMFDPKIYMRKAIDDVKTAVIRKIRLLYKL
jgi:tagatose 1,6-diphosphate aldolase GatY/KbaY